MLFLTTVCLVMSELVHVGSTDSSLLGFTIVIAYVMIEAASGRTNARIDALARLVAFKDDTVDGAQHQVATDDRRLRLCRAVGHTRC